MKESICTFGRHEHLTGIITSGNPQLGFAVILLNAGAVHKVGPFRLNVELARRCASLGIYALRFDLSGLGESERVSSSHSYDETVQQDVVDAIDYLQTNFPINNFAIIGLCTGADLAYKAAIHDSRITRLVCVDGYGYRTPRYYLKHYLKKLSRPRKVLAAIIRRIQIQGRSEKSPGPGEENQLANIRTNEDDNYYWYPPSRDSYRSSMRELGNRPDFSALLIYSGGVTDYFNYSNQMHDAFRGESWLKCVQVVYYPDSSHTFPLQDERHALFDRIGSYLSNNIE